MFVSCCYYLFKHCFRSVRGFSTFRWSTNAPEQFNPQQEEYRTMFSGQFVFLRPWIICHGQPSIAVSNATTATVGSSRFDIQTNIAAWHLLSWTIEKVCATSKPVYGHKQTNSIMSEYRWRLEKYVGLRQSGARLAHLSRLRTTTDSHFTSVYRDDDYCGLELDNTLYALDSSTIDLCLVVVP